MRYVYFLIGILFYLVFAYDIENDRDFFTWIWLLSSLFFIVNSLIRYQHDMKNKPK